MEMGCLRIGRRALERLSGIILVVLLTVGPCPALIPPACLGTNLSVGNFKLLVTPPKNGSPLPINMVNVIRAGDKLKYEPLQLPPNIRDKAKIAVLIVPAPEEKGKHLEVLDVKPAKSPAEWPIPMRTSIVGVVFGPHGLDIKKVNSLVKKDPDLIPELAQYAQKTATVNALVQTLSQYEQSQPGSEDLNAVLRGFSSEYGVALPRVATNAPAGEQASLLLQAVLPTLSNYDPLASERSLLVQQSAGLAASVASLFYGTPVGLAVGGAALVQNLRTMMSPDTDFRAAFVEHNPAGGMELCSQNQPPKPRTQIAYLWMLSVPNAEAPSVSLPQTENLPMGWKGRLQVTCETRDQLRLLPRARDWKLVSSTHSATVPATVTVGDNEDTLELDLSQAKLPAGEYHLAAMWDWRPLEVAGTLWLHPFSDFSNVKLTPESEDHLIQSHGPVKLTLIGADFEFVDKVAIKPSDDSAAKPQELSFILPKGQGHGDQLSMQVEVDTSKLQAGSYQLLLTQTNGKTQDVPVVVHPPNPTLEGLPLRANLGEPEQVILLRGTRLERVKSLECKGALFKLSPLPAGSEDVTERKAIVKLQSGLKKGDLLSANMAVEGLNNPIPVDDLLEVAGPRPRIVSVRESFSKSGDIALHDNEIPAGTAVSFAIRTENVDSRPSVKLACANSGDAREALSLQPGDRDGTAELDYAGEDVLFLSFDPGRVGHTGCNLEAFVATQDAGISDPYPLGRVIRLPQIDKFSLTNERLGRGLYAGTLTGQDLQMISKTGWNAKTGYPVQGIPTPVPGNAKEQTLKIELPWPPPAPEAPVYIWLRGEDQGRRTTATY
jgi:hypothetical protein